ncbi:MAG: beta-glucosidase BglX, partial [Bacteroidota bacterium]
MQPIPMQPYATSRSFRFAIAIALTAILVPSSALAQPGKDKPNKIKPKATATAATNSQKWYLPDTLGMDRYVSALMAKMTLEEKIGQLNLPTVGFDVTGPV